MSDNDEPIKLTKARRDSVKLDPETGNIVIHPRPKLVELLESKSGRLEAFEKLRQDLAIAAELYECVDDNRRAGMERALLAVLLFAESRGIPSASTHPLRAILAALVDAENGVATPAFTPLRVKTGGRPKKSVLTLSFEGAMATVAELCIEQCRKDGKRPYVDEGLAIAVRLINQSRTGAKITKTALRELRERVRAKNDGDDRLQFDIQSNSFMARQAPLEYAKMLINHDWLVAE